MGDDKDLYIKETDILKEYFGSKIVYLEHLSRYNFVKNFIRKKNYVLDLGCRIGDGTYILKDLCKIIVGVDIDKKALDYAKNYYFAENIRYFISDACNLSFKSNSFDVVVSLEVIEHILNQDRFLLEIKRVLKNNGIAIISTPNRDIIKIQGSTSNPTHIKELSFKEFKLILSKYFRNIKFYGQDRGKGIVGFGIKLHTLIRYLDFLNLRRFFLQNYKDRIYDKFIKKTGAKDLDKISIEDVVIVDRGIKNKRTIIAVCQK